MTDEPLRQTCGVDWNGSFLKTEANMNKLYDTEAVSILQTHLHIPDAAPAVSRIASFDWHAVANDVNESGNALLKEVLTSSECEALASLYASDEHFRSRVVMARHGFGRGEYQYFRYPLPTLLQQLRTALYRGWRRLPTNGITPWESILATRRHTRTSSSVATRQDRCVQHRCFFSTARGLALPASGPLWRTCLSDSGGVPPH